MEGDKWRKVILRTVFSITIDGMASAGELNADLMRSSGQQPRFDPGEPAMSSKAVVFKPRMFGLRFMRWSYFHDAGLMVFPKPIFVEAMFRFHLASHDSPIEFCRLPFAELFGQATGGFARSGVEQHTGYRSIQPMYH